MKTEILFISSLLIVSCSNHTLHNRNSSPGASPSSVRIIENDSGPFRKSAVVYNALSPDELFTAEYDYISTRFGERGKDWFLMTQTILQENEKIIDVIEIHGNNPSDQRVIFFDVTDVYVPDKNSAVTLKIRHK